MSENSGRIGGLDGNATNVLVFGPLLSTADERACVELLDHSWHLGPETDDPGSVGDGVDVVFVSFNRSPEECLDLWQSYAGQQAARVGILAIGDHGRFADPAERTLELPSGPVEIMSVRDPSDLPRIGLTLNAHLAEFEDDPRPTVVCFHSVTALLQFVEEDRAFRFLRILSAYLDTANAVAHYHMDPTVHSDRVVATFRPLFDAVVESSQIITGIETPSPPVADAPTVTDETATRRPVDEPTDSVTEIDADHDATAIKHDDGSPADPDNEVPSEASPPAATSSSRIEGETSEFIWGVSPRDVLRASTGPELAAQEPAIETRGTDEAANDSLGATEWTAAFETIMTGSPATEIGLAADDATTTKAAGQADPEPAADTHEQGHLLGFRVDPTGRRFTNTAFGLALFALGIVLIMLGYHASYAPSPLIERVTTILTLYPTLVFAGLGILVGGIGVVLLFGEVQRAK